MKTRLVEFKPPDGLSLPEGIQADEEFEALATFRLKKDGMICLVKIDGKSMQGYKDADEKDYRQSVEERYPSA